MSDIKVVKDEVLEEKEELQEETAEEKALKEEMAAIDEEEGIAFQETLTKDDLVQYNYYLLKNGSNYFRTGIMVLLGIFLIIYPIVQHQNYWIIGVGAFLVIFCLFLFIPLQKAMIRRQIKKKEIDQFVIDVKFASKIKYQLATEGTSPLVEYRNIYKVRKTKDYIYLHMSVYAVIIIKLSFCDNPDALVEFIKSKYEGTKKYREMK